MTALLASAASQIFEYPHPGYLDSLRTIAAESWNCSPNAAKLFEELYSILSRLSLKESKELYTRTFDLAPVCAPYLSVHLFGESNLKRAQLMAGLTELYIIRNVETQHELPDHIGVLLRSLEKLLPSERAEILLHCFKGSLKSMQAELARQENPYRLAIEAIAELVQTWLTQTEVNND